MFEHSTIVVRHDDGAYQAHGKVRDMAPHALFPRLIPLATLTELSLAPVSFVTTLGEGEVWDGDPDIPSGQLAASGSWEYGRPKRAMNEVEQLAELERLKDAKKASITARFRDLIAEGVTVDGEVIDLSPSGFTTLEQALSVVPVEAVTARGARISLPNQAAVNAILAAARARYKALVQREAALFDAVDAVTTWAGRGTLDNIDANDGSIGGVESWPAP